MVVGVQVAEDGCRRRIHQTEVVVIKVVEKWRMWMMKRLWENPRGKR
jgi:hypothetical protein